MPEIEDLYEILHLHPSAHTDVIQAAYRRLALLYHPDKNPSPEATEMMAAINRAYAVLSDPEKRAEYDRSRAARSGLTGSSASPESSSQPSPPRGSAPRNPAGYFSFASTRDEVADIHGTPYEIKANYIPGYEEWHYGERDTVTFHSSTGKVVEWSNFDATLRVLAMPGSVTTPFPYFMEGSNRDDVLQLQGTPIATLMEDGNGEEKWWYREGTVQFSRSTGKVVGWRSGRGVLKAKGESNWRTLSNEYNNVGIYTVDPIDPDYWLIVRFKDRELELYVTWKTQISYSDETTANYQIDNGPTWRQSWHVSTNREATFMPAHDIPETIRALFGAEEFTGRVYPFGGNPLNCVVPSRRIPRSRRSSSRSIVQRQLLLPVHCLTQIVTLRKWLPQLKCYRKLGRQPRGRRHQQDGEAGTCGDDPGPVPTGIQEGQREDTGRIHCDNRPPSQARHQAAGRHC